MNRPRSFFRVPLYGLAAATLLAMSAGPAEAQPGPGAGSASGAATPEAVVQGLFDAMRAGDSTAARRLLHPEARLHRPVTRDGEPALSVSGVDGWLEAIAGAEPGQLDEKIWDLEIRTDGRLATAWMRYAFFLDGELHHCGVNAFQLVRSAGGWRAFGIADTSREEGCEGPPGQKGMDR